MRKGQTFNLLKRRLKGDTSVYKTPVRCYKEDRDSLVSLVHLGRTGANRLKMQWRTFRLSIRKCPELEQATTGSSRLAMVGDIKG